MSHQKTLSLVGALLVAVVLIAATSFLTSPVFGQRVNNNNNSGGGNGGVVQIGNCGAGRVACDTPGYICPVGTTCSPSGAPGCGTCQGIVTIPGNSGGDSCDFGTCANPDGSQYCKPYSGFVCPAGGQPFDFTIVNDHPVSQPLAVAQNGTENIVIDLARIGGGATQQVSLTSQIVQKIGGGSFAQTDISRVFSQSTCNPTCSSTLVVTGNVVGNYVVRITGTAGAITHTTDAHVYVQTPPPPECDSDPAPSAKPLCGFAWGATNEGPASENGVGWLSFNSQDIGTGGTYRVTVSPDGSLKGCAWSPNIGWVKFNNLSGFPAYAGNAQRDARLASGVSSPEGQNTTLEGWARACAGTSSGDCSNMNDRADGWDGWISLKNGSIADGTVTYNGGIFGGNAWGSEVVGWMGFDTGNGSAVRLCNIQLFDFGINGPSSISIQQGQTRQVALSIDKIGTATSQNVALTSTVVTPPTAGSFSRSFVPTSGSPTFGSNLSITATTLVPPGSYTIRVTGTTPSGMTRTKDITVNVTSAPATSSDLVLTCTPPAGGVGYVNKPVVFGVSAAGSGTPPSTPVADFYFTTDGTAPTTASRRSSTNPLTNVSRTFTTIGRKTVVIKVMDSASPAATGECTVDVLIKVNPDINER